MLRSSRISLPSTRSRWIGLLLLLQLVSIGCSRRHYRLQADREVSYLVAEKSFDPRWAAPPNFNIAINPASRYYDPFNPDKEPMPADDPASRRYMYVVDGKKAWPHWFRNGVVYDLENPGWRDMIPEFVPIDEENQIVLTVENALALSYLHSPDWQDQLETLYLSALDVSTERFRLDTQFFGGYDATYVHNGSLIPSALRFDPVLGRFVVNPPINGVENNRLTVGRPSSADPALQARRRFATAGELLVGFANSFVFEFTGADANLATSIANFSLVQPLLRGAGRDIALEQLTIVERSLLANLRALSQYRQGFYTQVAIGELGVRGPQRRGGFFGGTGLTGFTGQGAGGFGGVGGGTFGFFGGGAGGGGGGGLTGFAGGGAGVVGGYIGLLQQMQQIRNTEESLNQQERTLRQLELYREAGFIDLVQVDQFRQSIETERANLLQARNSLQNSIESYLVNTIGLPPDLPVSLDDSLIEPFRFISPELSSLQEEIVRTQTTLGQLPDEPSVEQVRLALAEAAVQRRALDQQVQVVTENLQDIEQVVEQRLSGLTEQERQEFEEGLREVNDRFQLLRDRIREDSATFDQYREGLTADNVSQTRDNLVDWVSGLYRRTQELSLIQARARLETITVEPIELSYEQAFRIAVDNRMDIMNSRASLVDTWRLIQFNADALQGVLNLTASGDLRTARNNPLSFRAPTANLRFGLEFDAPLTRLLERNNYRQSLIDYQRARRGFIQSLDSVNFGLRSLLREIEQLRVNLEIQRRAVVIAIRRVDNTADALQEPPAPAGPGQPPQFGPTAALNSLTALSDLRNTLNNFMSVYLNYYANRIRLERELGVMQLDPDGRWLDESRSVYTPVEEIELPPPVPIEMLQAALGDQADTLIR